MFISVSQSRSTGGTATYSGTVGSDDLFVGRNTTTYVNIRLGLLMAFNTDESSQRTDIETDINTLFSIY